VLVLFLSIKICLFTSFLTICLKRREQAYLNKKEGNKHILIERKVTSTSW
jgi:hypothetical protein